jgi:hypothetical protein
MQTNLCVILNVGRKHMRKINALLLDTSIPSAIYVLRAYAIQIVPVVLLGLLIYSLVGSNPAREIDSNGTLFKTLELLLLAPLFENALLILLISLLGSIKETSFRAFAAALPFGMLHILGGPLGITAIWSFYVISMAYLAYSPQGKAKAYFISVGVHSCTNLAPAFATLFL